MPTQKFTIEDMFARKDRERAGSLTQARLAAILTKPYVLPPATQKANSELPPNYQSLGARGISILTGRLMLALYPAQMPFFVFTPAAHILNAPDADPVEMQDAQQSLFLYGRALMAKLEQQDLRPDVEMRRRSLGFRAHKTKVIDQVLITGDCLERMLDDYRLQMFRRDQYVTARDGAGGVMYHITREMIDVATLTDEQFGKSGLDSDVRMDPDPSNRMHPMFSWVKWEPFAKNWTIIQELNQNEIAESTEPVNPYICTPFELSGGEDYGRGFIESNALGDLRTLDELEMTRLDMLSLAGNMKIAKDRASLVSDKELLQPPGTVISGARVEGGRVQDIGVVSFTDVRDYSMLVEGVRDKRNDLGKSMLIESETVRNAERVTTMEISRNVAELNGALGGVYVSLAADQQIPLVARLQYQFDKDNGIMWTSDDEGNSRIEMQSVTGLAALNTSQEIDKLINALGAIQQLGEPAIGEIDMRVAVQVLLRQIGVHEPGLFKSDEQKDMESKRALVQQLAMAGGQQAIQTTGRIAEQQAGAQAGAQQQQPQLEAV